MTYQVELLVRLKIPDVTALTAANALRRRLGYAEKLVDLKRADHYLFSVEASSAEEAEAFVRQLAQKTTLFVNPNKHVFETRVVTGEETIVAQEGIYDVRCLVRDADYDPGEGLRNALSKLGFGDRISGLQTGTLWTLRLKATSAEDALGMAREIAVTKSRNRGLLANPHYQECVVY
ncbi:MAG: hypothetical protein N2512_06395 [Armatimonadetes bacterium]|nr:hypothetical protein [Armatimonadota bacterium]